jgi:hypothetical protein
MQSYLASCPTEPNLSIGGRIRDDQPGIAPKLRPTRADLATAHDEGWTGHCMTWFKCAKYSLGELKNRDFSWDFEPMTEVSICAEIRRSARIGSLPVAMQQKVASK